MLNYRFFKKLKLLKKLDMENGRVGLSSSQVNRVVGKKWVILSRLKTGSSQSGCESGRLTCIFHMNFFIFIIFILYIYIYIYKENNLYLPFGKSCNKSFDVKCIILNSLLISRMNSVKLINTYSIILKLYKSQHC